MPSQDTTGCAAATPARAGGAGSFVAEVLTRLHNALPLDQTGPARSADAARRLRFDSREVIRVCRRGGARFSVTARMNPSVHTARSRRSPSRRGRRSRTGHRTVRSVTPPTAARSRGRRRRDRVHHPSSAPATQSTCGWWSARSGPPHPRSQLAFDVAFSYHEFITDQDGELLDIEVCGFSTGGGKRGTAFSDGRETGHVRLQPEIDVVQSAPTRARVDEPTEAIGAG